MRLFLITAFFLAILSGGAEAKYSFCNKSSYTLSAAIGYVDGDRLATRGWWRLRPGQCKIVLTEPANPGRYFVYAEAIAGHAGPLRTWSGETALCVENAGFFNLRNQEVCQDDPTRQRKFFDVAVTEAAKGNWQTDFTETANYTVFSAEVAGVQRLLNDIGKKVGRIDGALGRDTLRVLAAYRKEKGLPEDDDIDDKLIDALIEDANDREAKLGFFYCNKTEAPVWSAIGMPIEEKEDGSPRYISQGWWKIAPGDCAKIVKGELKKDHYFIYGAIEDGPNERRIAGGVKTLCVSAVLFSATDDQSCADQELDEAVFRRVDIGSAESATFDFLPDMFVAPPAQ